MVKILDTQEELLPPDIHHTVCYFEIGASNVNNCLSSSEVPIAKRNFIKANYNVIVNRLLDVNWDSILTDDNLDSNLKSFYDVLNNVIVDNVPFSNFNPSTYPKWYDYELIREIQDKKRAHSVWKTTGDLSNYIEFKRRRAICVRLWKCKYREYIESVESSLHFNIKAFWSYVKTLNNDSSIPSDIFLNNNTANNDFDKASLFSSHFSSVFNKSNNDSLNQDHNVKEILYNIHITPELVSNIVNNLKVNTNAGLDNIPAYFVERCWFALNKPVLALFNKTLASGYFPTLWKSSYISPIFKSGDKHEMRNYRPISLLSCILNILDALWRFKIL